MWDVSGPFVKNWIRDELGPEAALADRLRDDTETLLRLPSLIRRLEERFPAKGAAPEPPPLPDVELIWDRRRQSSLRRWSGYILALLAGGIAVWGAGVLGWL